MFEKIKQLCKENGLTVAELERRAGLVGRTIHRWDYVMPAADKLARVASILGTTVEELLKE